MAWTPLLGRRVALFGDVAILRFTGAAQEDEEFDLALERVAREMAPELEREAGEVARER